ncbi:MAG: chorismate synthase [Spirochaetes bacterium]|nr:chorismate synthase [Spirochaetota bacterium]
MSSTFGEHFRVTTFGESHGAGIGAVIDGCPPGMELDEADIQGQLDRRRPGTGPLVTTRSESDRVEILSGTENGITLGSPIALLVRNADAKPADYAAAAGGPRPSHADFPYREKYGLLSAGGGGRSSARETLGRVAAGAVAGKVLRLAWGIEIVAWVSSIENVDAPGSDMDTLTRELVDRSPCRCPDPAASALMVAAIEAAKADKDSVGGIVSCACRCVPAGWGEPVFGKLDALLAHAMLSIPAVRGFELGSGFAASRMRGSAHNDAFVAQDGRLRAATNRAGGSLGGVSSGETVWFRVAFKPTPTIGRPQETAGWDGGPMTLESRGRHDPCVAIRAVPVVEAMAAIALLDLAFAQESRLAVAGRAGRRHGLI